MVEYNEIHPILDGTSPTDDELRALADDLRFRLTANGCTVLDVTTRFSEHPYLEDIEEPIPLVLVQADVEPGVMRAYLVDLDGERTPFAVSIPPPSTVLGRDVDIEYRLRMEPNGDVLYHRHDS